MTTDPNATTRQALELVDSITGTWAAALVKLGNELMDRIEADRAAATPPIGMRSPARCACGRWFDQADEGACPHLDMEDHDTHSEATATVTLNPIVTKAIQAIADADQNIGRLTAELNACGPLGNRMVFDTLAHWQGRRAALADLIGHPDNLVWAG